MMSTSFIHDLYVTYIYIWFVYYDICIYDLYMIYTRVIHEFNLLLSILFIHIYILFYTHVT